MSASVISGWPLPRRASWPTTGWILGARADLWCIIFSPVLASVVALGAGAVLTEAGTREIPGAGRWLFALMAPFTYGHVYLTLFRSHLNASIFRQHPIRFVVAPLLLLLGLLHVDGVRPVATWVLVWWNMWHTAMQTFGLGRIYDARAGNHPEDGRDNDMVMVLAMSFIPTLGGPGFLTEFNRSLAGFQGQHADVVRDLGFLAGAATDVLTWGGAVFLVGMVAVYARDCRRLTVQGYRHSPQKLMLFAITGLCTAFNLGLNVWGQGFLAQGIFHAVQYVAMVHMVEKKNLSRLMGLGLVLPTAGFTAAVLTIFMLTVGEVHALAGDGPWGNALDLTAAVVSLMHFWYDGFVWSVRKNHV